MTAAATFTTNLRPKAYTSLQISSGQTLFKGQIDDVMVFNRAVTAVEVAALHRGYYPVFRLPLDDTEFSNDVQVNETSRFRHAATWQGGNPIGRPVAGAVGNGALAFDGTASQINVAAADSLNLSDGVFTQIAWVYPQNNGGPVIDSVTNAAGLNTAYPFLNIVNSNQLEIGFGDGSSFHSYTSGTLLTPDAWNFIAITFDGTTSSIYVNGVLQETTTQFAGLVPASSSQFNIGYRDDGTGARYFDGMLDEIVIYRQALTPEQIASLRWQGWHDVTMDASGAGVVTSNWQSPVPSDLLVGSYQIRLRTSDVNGNVSFDHNDVGRWSGYIGYIEPMVEIPKYEIFLPLAMNGWPVATGPNLPDLIVEEIAVVDGSVSVVLRNVGNTAVTNEFWVDLYLNPSPAPTAVNQTWPTLSTQGAVWGIEANLLPLNPGETITLSLGDAQYWPSLSNMPSTIPPGTQIYVQVDSANANTSYGGVLETHEQTGATYNNISSTVADTSMAMQKTAAAEAATAVSTANALPPR